VNQDHTLLLRSITISNNYPPATAKIITSKRSYLRESTEVIILDQPTTQQIPSIRAMRRWKLANGATQQT